MRVPGSSCFALAFISLLQSGFPIYFSYSWASIYDDDMLNDTDNWTKYEVTSGLCFKFQIDLCHILGLALIVD